jgi:hypothetical protein
MPTALLQSLKNRGFMVKEHGPYVLVHPSRGKFDWEPDELGFRSALLERASGRVVSCGWPKFFNQGEWPDHDDAVARELAAGTAVITHKHDGSLIIRSVLPDGTILLRTRDTFDGGKFGALADAVVRARYPALLDPDVYPHGSLLFEYVGAGNQIVVRYAGEDDLILLGAAEHGDAAAGPRYLPYAELADVAHVFGLRLVETYGWAENGIAGVLGMVQNWDKAEGVVVRSACGQTLLKIKSAWYFAQHALRWQVKRATIARFCIDGGITDEATFLRRLTETGWDYETAAVALGYFHQYRERRREADRLAAAARALVAAFDAETAGTFPDERARRKAFAARLFGPGATAEARALAPYCFLVYDGKQDRLEATLLRRIVLGPGR